MGEVLVTAIYINTYERIHTTGKQVSCSGKF